MNSIPEFFKRSVEANPKKTAVIIQEQKYSYEEIDQMSSSIAQNLSVYPSNSVLSMMLDNSCLLYTSPSPRDATLSRMPSSA